MEIEAITVDSAINNLTKTVFSLQSKVLSLEKTISRQNDMIMKLLSAYEKYSVPGVDMNIEAKEGRRALKPSQQSMCNIRDQTMSAISATDRKSKGHVQSPAQSQIVATAEPIRMSPNHTSNANAPASPSVTDQRDCLLNIEPTTKAHKDVINNSTSVAYAQIDEWVNVKPRRSRRARAANGSLNAVGDQMTQEISSMEVSGNPTKMKTTRINPIIRGCNTSVLRIKAVERKKYFHVWRLLTDTSVENLTDYVREILGSDSYIKVDKINHKTVRGYSSFRICVSDNNFEKLCDPSIWPKDAEFSEWVFFRRSTTTENIHTQKK